ncbi:MAG: hypothetical protein IKO43_05265 [Kiritimatiellae bacterium]|nr:hypothetical protein [Kiritimatiellia bacterium]
MKRRESVCGASRQPGKALIPAGLFLRLYPIASIIAPHSRTNSSAAPSREYPCVTRNPPECPNSIAAANSPYLRRTSVANAWRNPYGIQPAKPPLRAAV